MLYFISHHFKIALKESLYRSETFEEEKYGVKFASECEVCKIFTQEFEAKLKESSKKHEVSFSHPSQLIFKISDIPIRPRFFVANSNDKHTLQLTLSLDKF